jgi:HEPN domain-containing protein
MQALTREWVEKAEEDYSAASGLNRRRKNRLANIQSFHCQQCVEKYLKARLVEAGIAPSKTHDLRQLLSVALPLEPLWESLKPAAEYLSQFAVAYRYPGTDATDSQAKRAYQMCRDFRREARIALGSKP